MYFERGWDKISICSGHLSAIFPKTIHSLEINKLKIFNTVLLIKDYMLKNHLIVIREYCKLNFTS